MTRYLLYLIEMLALTVFGLAYLEVKASSLNYDFELHFPEATCILIAQVFLIDSPHYPKLCLSSQNASYYISEAHFKPSYEDFLKLNYAFYHPLHILGNIITKITLPKCVYVAKRHQLMLK